MKHYSILSIILIGLVSQCKTTSTDDRGSWDNPAFDYVAEGRGVWGGGGRRDGEIDSMMMKLADAGINMIFPNISTAGQASYPSSVLPKQGETDKLALLVESAHKYGIEIHAWRINWFMGWGPESFAEEMIKQNRIQYSWDGRRNGPVMKEMGYNQPEDWLCPSHPANRELEKEAMLELVRNYDVDGVHFDYMRYSNDHFCYCDGCRERFSEAFNLTLDNWPDPVWKEGELREVYLEWRRQLIHTSARDIARAVHKLDPYVSVTLAARNSIEWCTYSDGQEWWKWCDEGILDVLCAMNYTTDSTKFIVRMETHLPLMKGSAPYYSGLGMYEMDSYDQLAANANAGRTRGHDGWIAFNQRSIMPYLDQVKNGINQKPALLPHRAPEVRWHFISGTLDDAPQGYPRYKVDSDFQVNVSIIFKAMLREGINRIIGDICLVNMEGDVLENLKFIDLSEAKRIKLKLNHTHPGRYRLAFYGEMNLSTGLAKPFITNSFPFEIINR
ncbi:glycoside hydrolase family 10 protein [Bacteroidota bacterium]